MFSVRLGSVFYMRHRLFFPDRELLSSPLLIILLWQPTYNMK